MVYRNESFDKAFSDEFMFGASYAPYALGEEWPEEEWEQDILRMKEMQFNTIRIFITWSRIEKKKDQYDFSMVDTFFELAKRHGMKVIVNFGGLFGNACGMGRPWYLRDVEDFCNDNPYVAQRADLFLRKAVERYRSREELIGWMTWNEPNNMEQCKCKHTMKYFRRWLKEKYGSIEALNRAWEGGEPVCFESFEEIRGKAGQGMAGSLDLARFHQWNLKRRMIEIKNIAEELDPEHRFTTANMVYHSAATEGPTNSSTYGVSIEQMGEAMSMMGVSCYIIEHRYDPQPAWKVSYKLSRLRTASCDEHHRMIILETGAGPNIRQLSPVRRNTLMWQMVAHNIKGMLMWNYRCRLDGGQVALFQLMAFDGSLTERGEEIAKLNALFQKNAKLLNHVYPSPEAAVLTLEDTMLMQEANYPIGSIHSALDFDRVQESRFGAYKMLWDMKISADCLTESRLNDLSKYKVILMPAQEQMTPALSEALKKYVAEGGTLIAEGPLGFRNEEARLIYKAPGYGMDEVFGCYLNDRQKSTVASTIILQDGSEMPVCDFYSVLYPTTAEVVCRYSGIGGLDMSEKGKEADGEELVNGRKKGAAITVNRYGKGLAVCAGTEIFRIYATAPNEVLSKWMKQLIKDTGICPDVELEGDTENVEAVRLCGEKEEDGVLYLLTNHSEECASVRAKVRENGVLVDIEDGSEYASEFEKTLKPWETLALCVK